ncbi:phospholipase-like protein [Tanacetum coccineum]
MLWKQHKVDEYHNDMPLIYYVEGYSLHFGRTEFALITGMRFGRPEFCSYTSTDLKFRNRVFPHKVGFGFWSLLKEVIVSGLMPHKLYQEQLDGLKSPYLKDLIDSKTNTDIRPTRAEYESSWWIESNVFFEHRIPKPPEIEHRPLFQAYLSKLEKSRKRLASSFRESSSVCTRDSRLKTRRIMDRRLQFNEDLSRLRGTEIVFGRRRKDSFGTVKENSTREEVEVRGRGDVAVGRREDVAHCGAHRLIGRLYVACMPLFYANGDKYGIPWSDVDQVFIPINETDQHWCLAHLDILSGLVTFYDSEDTYDYEWRDWYVIVRQCLEERLPVILEGAKVFDKKGIHPSDYTISFKLADNVPKQGDVEDLVDVALAYREKMHENYVIFEVNHDGVFNLHPLRYDHGKILTLKLSKLIRMSFSKLLDMLSYKLECEIWGIFYSTPRSSLEEGLTIVEDDFDMNKMYDMGEKYGLINLYIAHLPKKLAKYYYKNLSFDAADEDVLVLCPLRSLSHRKKKKLVHPFADELGMHDNWLYEGLSLDGPIDVVGPSTNVQVVLKKKKGRSMVKLKVKGRLGSLGCMKIIVDDDPQLKSQV